MLTKEQLCGAIDYSVLTPDSSLDIIIGACKEAIRYNFAALCVMPCWVETAKEALAESKVSICTTVGFPTGANVTAVKVLEASEAIKSGANELDMVLNLGALKSGNYRLVSEDIKAVVDCAKPYCKVKVIIEACYLTREEKIAACEIVKSCGADMVKTSTGFGPSGATIEDVKLIRKVVGESIGIKAAGGIRTLAQALAFISAGANRIGTSSAVEIVKEFEGLQKS